MLHVVHSDPFMIGFKPEQMVGGPKRLKWAKSSGKLLIHPLPFCPLYSLTKVVRGNSSILACWPNLT